LTGPRRWSGNALADLPVVRQVLKSGDPTSEYKARALLLDEAPGSARLKKLRAAIGSSERARRLLAGRLPDGTIDKGPYRKWQGPHWTLYSLALIDYPPGDRSLLPLRDQVYDWLLDPAHLEFRQSLLLPGQEDRFRRCASQEGKLRDPRCREALELLAAKQRPDGGFPLELCNATTSDRLVTRGSRADWGPRGRTRTNPLVSIEALRVLAAARGHAG